MSDPVTPPAAPAATESATPSTPAAAAPPDPAAALAQLERNATSGANWFWWVAGLSVVNSIMIAMHSDTVMVLGLGITQVIDILITSSADKHPGVVAHILHAVLVLIPIGIFYAIGRRARARSTAAIKLGIVLYALDAAIPILAGDGMGIGFHALVLFFLYRAHGATKLLNAVTAPGSKLVETVQT